MLCRGLVPVLTPFERFPAAYNLKARAERYLGFGRVLAPGDVAVQVGCLANTRTSDLFRVARIVGQRGTVVAIEADERGVAELERIASTSVFNCKFHIVNKAAFSRPGRAELLLGSEQNNNALTCIPGSSRWYRPATMTTETIPVEIDTIDNILAGLRIAPSRVAYVNLTINGAELDALRGTVGLLRDSRNLSITVTAGRENEGGRHDIGYLDGEPDRIVISRFLAEFGFRVSFRRFGWGTFGYVIATKGDQRVFM